MRNKKEYILPTVVFIISIIIWECFVTVFHTPSYLLPKPSAILEVMFLQKNQLWHHSIYTLKSAVMGLLLAIVLGFVLGILMDIYKGLHKSIYPHLIVSQTIPIMVLAPLFSIWFGFGLTPKVLIVMFMCFFPIVINFVNGMKQVPKKQLFLLQSYGAKRWHLYRFMKIPYAREHLFSGIKIAATYCITGSIVGEWISSEAGLGYYMIRMKNSYQMPNVFASIVCVVLLSLLLHGIVCIVQGFICKR